MPNGTGTPIPNRNTTMSPFAIFKAKEAAAKAAAAQEAALVSRLRSRSPSPSGRSFNSTTAAKPFQLSPRNSNSAASNRNQAANDITARRTSAVANASRTSAVANGNQASSVAAAKQAAAAAKAASNLARDAAAAAQKAQNNAAAKVQQEAAENAKRKAEAAARDAEQHASHAIEQASQPSASDSLAPTPNVKRNLESQRNTGLKQQDSKKTVLKEGDLEIEMKGTFFNSWKSRHFALYPDRLERTNPEDPNSKTVDTTELKNIVSVAYPTGTKFEIVLKNDKSIKLEADTNKTAHEWVQAIRLAMRDLTNSKSEKIMPTVETDLQSPLIKGTLETFDVMKTYLGWVDGYFILYHDRLVHKASESFNTIIQTIMLKDIVLTSIMPDKDKPTEFKIVWKGKTVYLKAKDKELAEKWVTNINSAKDRLELQNHSNHKRIKMNRNIAIAMNMYDPEKIRKLTGRTPAMMLKYKHSNNAEKKRFQNAVDYLKNSRVTNVYKNYNSIHSALNSKRKTRENAVTPEFILVQAELARRRRNASLSGGRRKTHKQRTHRQHQKTQRKRK